MRDNPFMRTQYLLVALAWGLSASPAAAQLALPPDEERAPSRLAELEPDSDWHERFELASRQLRMAMAERSKEDWFPLFGGQWLAAADKARIGAILADDTLAFRKVFGSGGEVEHIILGWQPPEGGAPYAALADRPEGDAIICWRRLSGGVAWPQTAAEAENRNVHACVRVSYSIRFDPPQWRAFMDAPVD